MKKILLVATVYRIGERIYPIIPELSKYAQIDLYRTAQMSDDITWYGDNDYRLIFDKLYESYADKIYTELPDIKSKYHKYGGLEFQINGREVCHIHGDGLTDVLLNKECAKKLIRTTKAEEHHVIKKGGWISYQITSSTISSELIQIIQQAYDLKK